jgi:NitT/TauT family transport system substrate-binding protein
MWTGRPQRRLLLIALAAIALAGATGCAGQAHVDQDASGVAHVNVSVLAIANVAPLYLGIRKGYFRAERLDVKPQIAQTGAATIAAVVSGKNQFGYTTTTSHAQAAAKGLGLRAVAAAAWAATRPQDSFAGLMVKADGPIRDPHQLAGKTIAVNGLNNVNQVTIDAALRRRGIDTSHISYLEVPLPNMAAALKAGRVDAADVVEPFLTIGTKNGERSLLDNYREAAPGLMIGTYFTTGQFVRKYPDVTRRFARAMNRSVAYAASHPEEARAALLTYTQIKPAIAKTMRLPRWSTQLTPADMTLAAKLTRDAGLLGAPKLPDPRKMLYGGP